MTLYVIAQIFPQELLLFKTGRFETNIQNNMECLFRILKSVTCDGFEKVNGQERVKILTTPHGSSVILHVLMLEG